MTVRTILQCLAICCGLLPGAAVYSAAGDVTEKRVLAESSQGENWFLKGGNFRGEHFSPLNEINDKNVDQPLFCGDMGRCLALLRLGGGRGDAEGP